MVVFKCSFGAYSETTPQGRVTDPKEQGIQLPLQATDEFHYTEP